jgi:DNA-binding transcriptional LysR family regulator
VTQDAPVPEVVQPGTGAGGGSLRELDLRRLRLFVAVADELHFGRAAQRMRISQPPLTKHIQALEAALGTRLFNRERRAVTLTPAGAMLLAEARSLLAHAERVAHVMQGAGRQEFTSLFIGSVPFALADVLPRVLLRFRKASPGTRLALSEGHTAQVVDRVQRGELDFGVVWKNFGADGLNEMPLVTGTFSAVLPQGHRLLSRQTLRFEDLAGEPLVLPSRTHSPYHHDRLVAAFVNAGVTPRVEYLVPMILSQLGYVAGGLGIALVPDIARRLPHRGVAFRPFAAGSVDFALTLIWADERVPQVGRRFIEVAQQLCCDGDEGPAPVPDGGGEDA